MANKKATPMANNKATPVAAPVATGEFEWRCLTCGKTALPTKGAYMKGHQTQMQRGKGDMAGRQGQWEKTQQPASTS